MARPRKDPTEALTGHLATRVTVEDRAKIEARAQKAGLPVSSYIRKASVTGKVTVSNQTTASRTDAAVLSELNASGLNLNQIAHALNIIKMKSGDPQALATLQGLEHQLALLVADQKEVKHLIRQALLNHDPEE